LKFNDFSNYFWGLVFADYGCEEYFPQLISVNILAMETIIKDYYSAYEKKDWNLLENLLAEGFTFTSPNDDDHINVKAFKEKCWPEASKLIKSFDVDKILGNGDEAFARYQGVFTNGATIRNTEYFKFENGKIKEIEVFFGPGQGFLRMK
jgi:hypothetical protein